MKNQNFTIKLLVDKTPLEVFNAINNVRGWWSGEIEGITHEPGAKFTYRVRGVHFSIQEITEFVPGKKIVWHILEAKLNFVNDKNEWKDTDITFEIVQRGDKTELCFTHLGLIPDYECYNDCSNAWGILVNGNLRNLITTGKNQPSPW